jgi:hypothetical protein
MLPHKTACKAGAFLVEPHPLCEYCRAQHRSACRPGAAPGLDGFGDLPVQAGTRHICGSNGAASRLRSGVSTMASSHLGYWTMAA